MLTITLVVVNGRLVGKSFSDTWNLDNLLTEMGIESIPYHKNGAGLKGIRATFGTDFAFKVEAKGSLEGLTPAEGEAMDGFLSYNYRADAA